MAASTIRLYRADTGALLGRLDVGDGLRAKTWADELPAMLLEAATRRGLANDGYGVLANFPAWIDGRKTQSRPVGEALSTKLLTGVELFKCVPQTQSMGLGDAAVTAFGDVALTQPDRAHADFYNTTTDPDDPVAPRGARAPAFLRTISDAGGNFGLAVTDGGLTLVINGTTYTASAAQMALIAADQTAAQLKAVLDAFAWPIEVVATADGMFLNIFAMGSGATRNIMAVTTVGDAGTVLFTGAGTSSQPNVMYHGTGSPLGQMDNVDAVGGIKPQRRILPLSLSITMTMAAEVVVARELTSGVITGSNIAGTATVTGTLTHLTGAIEFDTVGDAPDNATAITARFKALVPVNMWDEVVVPPGGMDLAILVS